MASTSSVLRRGGLLRTVNPNANYLSPTVQLPRPYQRSRQLLREFQQSRQLQRRLQTPKRFKVETFSTTRPRTRVCGFKNLIGSSVAPRVTPLALFFRFRRYAHLTPNRSSESAQNPWSNSPKLPLRRLQRIFRTGNSFTPKRPPTILKIGQNAR